MRKCDTLGRTGIVVRKESARRSLRDDLRFMEGATVSLPFKFLRGLSEASKA